MRYFFLLLFGICSPIFARSQTQVPLLNLYLDPADFSGDDGFYKQELQFVNHVSDRRLSDVQVQAVYEPVGNGSVRYRYLFFGYGRFDGQNDTVTWHLNAAELKGIFREKSLRALKRGLLSYLMQTSWADSLEYHFSPLVNNQQVRDRWNLWTFNVYSYASLAGSRDKQANSGLYSDKQRRMTLREDVDAWQITPDHRLGAHLDYQFNNSSRSTTYTNDSTITNDTRNQSIRTSVYGVRSIGAHWAVGTQMQASKYFRNDQNSTFQSSVELGLEYNLFPYNQFFRRRFLAGVSVGMGDVQEGFTVWNKLATASLVYAQVARWGYVEAGISERATFNNNGRSWSFQGSARVGWNVAKNLFIIAEPIIQQSISRTNFFFSETETTHFQYQFFLGLSYYFGSGYRNVVNPRLSNRF